MFVPTENIFKRKVKKSHCTLCKCQWEWSLPPVLHSPQVTFLSVRLMCEIKQHMSLCWGGFAGGWVRWVFLSVIWAVSPGFSQLHLELPLYLFTWKYVILHVIVPRNLVSKNARFFYLILFDFIRDHQPSCLSARLPFAVKHSLRNPQWFICFTEVQLQCHKSSFCSN